MKKILYILLIFVPLSSVAQPIVFEQQQYPFPVTFYGVEPQLGFLNSYTKYHPDFGDIDNDGDLDMIFGAGSAKEILCLNIGNNEQAEFELITDQFVFPGEYGNVCPPVFADIDNDGDLDLFTGFNNGYLVFFRNTGTPDSANYELETNDYLGVVLGGGCPSHDFIDIDADGDLDYFAGSIGQYFGEIIYFENVGTPDTADFTLITEEFENIDVDGTSAPEFCDIDGDDDFDLFVGCEDGTVWFYENIGRPDTFDFEYVTDNYNGIDVGRSSVPRFCDIDNDGDFDLFVANESAGNNTGFVGDMDFYRNDGTPNSANFTFVTGQYLFMDMNSTSSPNVLDIDDDGLLEMIVGAIGGNLIYFENEGTATEPSLVYTDSMYLDLQLAYQPTLSFGDLDRDNDLDFVVSRRGFTDYVDIYKNIGSVSEPVYEFWENITASYDSGYTGIALCDIDSDNDLDLFIGNETNDLEYWKNIGSASDPRFTIENARYLNQPYNNNWKYPYFNDIDHDGDYDLFLGYSNGSAESDYLILWLNIGTALEADFAPSDTLLNVPPGSGGNYRPCLADIDGDGDEDVFVGEGGGAMLFFRNMEFNSVVGSRSSVVSKFALYQNYPNPFNALTVIGFELQADGYVSLDVFDITGRAVGAKDFSPLQRQWMPSGYQEIVWDASGVASGVYFVRLSTLQSAFSDLRHSTMKTILVK